MIPLYDIFCEVTGLNGKNYQVLEMDQALNQSDQNDGLQRATLKFLADADSRDKWQFSPEFKSLNLEAGKMITTFYEVTNYKDKPVTIQAVPSVAPGEWAEYLVKIECFCFNEQIIQPGESLKLPLQVTLSAKAPSEVNHLSLSYRLYEIDNQNG